MKVRVYDAAARNKAYKGYVDRYSLYFPYTKEMRERHWEDFSERVKGDFLGFSFSEDGSRITRCTWDSHKGPMDWLGKKVRIETLPQPVVEWVAGYEKVWNALVYAKEGTKEFEAAEKAWNDYF
ncbi:MAG: hypothetical protein J6Y37_15200 [Paludibacteraceae bacterium]|nr:hypothetical protein [Paludibacteraceae bacterium]